MKAFIIERPSGLICKVAQFLQVEEQEYVFVGASAKGELEAFNFSSHKGYNQFRIISEGFGDFVHFKEKTCMDMTSTQSLFLSQATKKESRKYSFEAYICSGKNVYQLSLLFDSSSPVSATLKLENKQALFDGDSGIEELICSQVSNQHLYVLFKSLKGEFVFGDLKLPSVEDMTLPPPNPAQHIFKKTVLDEVFDCKEAKTNNRPCYFLLSQVTGKDHPRYVAVYYASGDNLLYKMHNAEEPIEYKSKLNCVSGAVIYPDINYKFNNYQIGGGFPIFNSQTNHSKPCVKLISLSSSATASSFVLDRGSAFNIHLKVAKFGPLYYNDGKNKHDIFFGIDVQNKIHIRHQSAAKIEKIANHEMTDACWSPDGSCIFIPTTSNKVLLFKFKSELENTFPIEKFPNLKKRILDSYIDKKKPLLNKFDFSDNQVVKYSKEKRRYILKASTSTDPAEKKKAKGSTSTNGNDENENKHSLKESESLVPKQQHMSDNNIPKKQIDNKLISTRKEINEGSNILLPSRTDTQIVTDDKLNSQSSESSNLKRNNTDKSLPSVDLPQISFSTSLPSANLESNQSVSLEAENARTVSKNTSVALSKNTIRSEVSADAPLGDAKKKRDSVPASEYSMVLIHQNVESPSNKIIAKTTEDLQEVTNSTDKQINQKNNTTASISGLSSKVADKKLPALNNEGNTENLEDDIGSKNNSIAQSKSVHVLGKSEANDFNLEGTLPQATEPGVLETAHSADKKNTSLTIDSSKVHPSLKNAFTELEDIKKPQRTNGESIQPKVIVSEITFKDKSVSKNDSTSYGLELSAILNPSDDLTPHPIAQNKSADETGVQPTTSNTDAVNRTEGSQFHVNNTSKQAIQKTDISPSGSKNKQLKDENSKTKLGRKKRNGSNTKTVKPKISKILQRDTFINKTSSAVNEDNSTNAETFKDSSKTSSLIEESKIVKNPPVSIPETLNTRTLKESEGEPTTLRKTMSKKKVNKVASVNPANDKDLTEKNVKASSEAGSPETKALNVVSTTIKVHAPSYIVPKDLKRKVAEIDPLNSDAPIKKSKKDLEHLEFSDRLMLNPIVAFSKVRISIPKTRTSFENIILDLYKVEVVNGNGTEQNPSKISVRSLNTTDTMNSVSEVLEKPLFENYQFFVKNITLATGTSSFFAFCSENGIVMICSPKTGMRLEQPLVLGVPISFLESSGDFLVCATTIGDVYCWNIKEHKLEYPVVSLYPILSPFLRASNDILSRAENITELSVTNSGIVIVTLSNGDAFLYDKMMQSWSLINDSWWAYSSRYWDASNNKAGRISSSSIEKRDRTEGDSVLKMLEYKTNEELKRKGVIKLMQNFAKTMLLKEGFENLEQSVSISHLVNKLFVYMKFEEYDNYKDTMITLCSTLAEFDLIDKLSEVFEFLFGENGSEDMIGYLKKHDLLKIVIAAVYQIGTHECKRLARMYADELNMV